MLMWENEGGEGGEKKLKQHTSEKCKFGCSYQKAVFIFYIKRK
jgi:hypothetical protein